MKTKSPAKALVFDFLKTCGMEEEFSFVTKKGEGRNMLHRMRVELSRLRELAKSMGRTPKPFKVMLVSIKDSEEGKEEVTLKKTQTETQQVTEELVGLLDTITLS